MNEIDYTVLHLFCGIGGAALGFQQACSEYKGLAGKFRTLAGIDCDPEACTDFETITGAPAVQMDLFNRDDYTAFHGHEPADDWREVTTADLLGATGGEYPDVIFLSPPCKGFSGLLPKKSAGSQKYQALNHLVTRGLRLAMGAFEDDLPAVIMIENVPRITSRGKELLAEVKRLLGSHGYEFNGRYHDCGEIGGLAQHRKRYLLIARNREKMSAFIYQTPKRRVRAIGDVLGPLAMPDDESMGPMHRLPRLQWKTWMRLALIPAGGDWRDLEKVAVDKLRLQHVPRDGVYQVAPWDEPCNAIVGHARPGGSNGVAAVSDPRLQPSENRHPGVYQVVNWDDASPCVTGTRFGSGAPAVADPRIPFNNIFRVTKWNDTPDAVTSGNGQTGTIVADPRVGCKSRPSLFGVADWDKPISTVIGTASVSSSNGVAAVADPRVPYSNCHQVQKWDEPSHTVTSASRPIAGSISIADPRTGFKPSTHTAIYRVSSFNEPANTVTGAMRPNNGAISIADPRTCHARNGVYGVMDWEQSATTVIGSADVHAGTSAVADPRIPSDHESGAWVIIALDGTWHRPLTTLELAALQGFPMVMPDGRPLVLAGKSDARWRERVGNAVPPPAARAIGDQILNALLVSSRGDWVLGTTGMWVMQKGEKREWVQ